MENCKLCLKREANKKGSHVIPHFLIKSMVNEGEDKKARDKEVSFRIGTAFTDFHFGRNVLPEKIQEVLGRELSEEEISTNENHFVVDYFLCSTCEDRFGLIETYYSEKSRSFKVHGRIKTNYVDSRISLLFWYSILWRISVTKILGVKLKPGEEKGIRNLLNTCLGESKNELVEKIGKFENLIKRFGYIILNLEEVHLEKGGTYVTIHPFHRRPYCVIINDYVVFFYLKSSHFKSVEQSFFSYEKHLKKELMNPYHKNENLCVLNEKENSIARQKMLIYMSRKRIKDLVSLAEETILKLNPNESKNFIRLIQRELIDEVVLDENVPLAEKYTIERFAKAFLAILKKYDRYSIQ